MPRTQAKAQSVQRDLVVRRVTVDKRTIERIDQVLSVAPPRSKASTAPGRRGYKNELLADMIEWILLSRDRKDGLRRFYLEEWIDKLEPSRNTAGIPLKWRRSADVALSVIAQSQLHNNGNLSEAFRVAVAFASRELYGVDLVR